MIVNHRRSSAYDSAFFRSIGPGARRSAASVLPVVKSLFEASSVVDFGCGDGSWLAVWRDLGVTDLHGVDGSDVSWQSGDFGGPRDHFDLATELDLYRRFDLAMCLEVGEHLPIAASETLVSNLTRHSATVLFSAAIPGQGGIEHVNEQPPGFWIELFGHHAYRVFDVLRPMLWDNEQIEVWYRQNLLVFVETSSPVCARLSTLQGFAGHHLVHPGTLAGYTEARGVRASGAQLWAATVRASQRRLSRSSKSGL
jgi:hypothetical protein